MIKFFLIVNKLGQLRLCRYYEKTETHKYRESESSIINTCLRGKGKQCTVFHHEEIVIIYRKYVNLCLIAGITPDENELSVLELMHNFLETLNSYFENVCELDIMYNSDRVYMILDEMIVNGAVAQTSKERILAPLQLMDTTEK
ncbi:AP-4 complex subunit sigma-1-like [Babylonia areolata]|uniref:AP-4 complex subunit sigma-1-like n=1 Tax=Babylonia areolata TaxID=304850 RepID=UPI003FCFE4A9